MPAAEPPTEVVDVPRSSLSLEQLTVLERPMPVTWHEPDADPGFWIVTRQPDVLTVSITPQTYSSYRNTQMLRSHRLDQLTLEAQRFMLLNLDPPAHTKLRAIVQRAFTVRSIEGLRDRLAGYAREYVQRALDRGEGDFVADIAGQIPLLAIAELLGVPAEDRPLLSEWSELMIRFEDPAFADAGKQASLAAFGYANTMAVDRKATPTGDVVSRLVHADVDGAGLTEIEFDLFFTLLMIGGTETTRNAIAYGILAFLDDPEQWALYRSERPRTTADEVIRWTTPALSYQRTAMQDTVLGGQPIAAGDLVGVFLRPANRDPDVFADPDRFDIRRDPNPHVSFGGRGPHFCLGASLARLEIDVTLAAIADLMPNLAQAGPPSTAYSTIVRSISGLPMRYRA